MNPCFLQELDLIIINFEICLKDYVMLFGIFLKSLDGVRSFRYKVISIQSHFDTKSFR